jgi:putative FmdB family regulatory protein
MAVYEFECQACGERFAVTVPMSEHDRFKEQPPTCPKCGEKQARQLVSHFECKTASGYA